MENFEITQKIKNSISILYGRERELIQDANHEQAISAKLMCYLQKEFWDDWNVDVEYNRQWEFPENWIRDTKQWDDGKPKKPDIIIHKRWPRWPNLAVLLIKWWWNHQDRSKDEDDVRSIKNQHNYQLAFTLEFRKEAPELKSIE